MNPIRLTTHDGLTIAANKLANPPAVAVDSSMGGENSELILVPAGPHRLSRGKFRRKS